MMRLLAVVTGIALLVPTAGAEPSSEVAFDVTTVRLLRAADPARGEALAKEGKCAKCHGDAGGSDAVLLFHDADTGREAIRRLGPGLAERVIPLEVEELGSVGMDT